MKKRPEEWENMLKPKYRWPKQGEPLLHRWDAWTKGVGCSKQPITRHAYLWDGYLSAGAGLIELSTREGYEHERHFVVYPILFNYRHGLELAMKWIIVMYGGQGIQEIANA